MGESAAENPMSIPSGAVKAAQDYRLEWASAAKADPVFYEVQGKHVDESDIEIGAGYVYFRLTDSDAARYAASSEVDITRFASWYMYEFPLFLAGELVCTIRVRRNEDKDGKPFRPEGGEYVVIGHGYPGGVLDGPTMDLLSRRSAGEPIDFSVVRFTGRAPGFLIWIHGTRGLEIMPVTGSALEMFSIEPESALTTRLEAEPAVPRIKAYLRGVTSHE